MRKTYCDICGETVRACSGERHVREMGGEDVSEKTAIEILREMEQMPCFCESCQGCKAALKLAIEALEQMGCGCVFCLAQIRKCRFDRQEED